MNLISEINFGLPGALPPSRTYELRAPSIGGTAGSFGPGQVIQFSIPSIDRTFFENNTTYITGRTAFTVAAPFTASEQKFFTAGGAYGQFVKWALRTANGQALDNIDNPGYLMGMILNIGMSVGQKISCANTILTSDQTGYTNAGYMFNVTRVVVDWAIPMVGIWNNAKYFPAWGNELILELTLQNAASNFIIEPLTTSGAITTYSVTNLEFVSQMLEFSPETFNQIQQMYGGSISIKSETFSFGSYLLPASTSAGIIEIPLNIRVKSLKRLMMLCSPSNCVEGVGYGAVNPNLDYYQLSINGLQFPQRGVQCTKPAECFMQLLRAFGSIYSSDKPTTIQIESFKKASTAYVNVNMPGTATSAGSVYKAYTSNTGSAATTVSNLQNGIANQFYMVLDLEHLSNGKEGLYNGIPTNGTSSNVIRYSINTALAAVSHYVYFYTCQDAIITFDFNNGITSVLM
jgi:hypothetical protein